MKTLNDLHPETKEAIAQFLNMNNPEAVMKSLFDLQCMISETLPEFSKDSGNLLSHVFDIFYSLASHQEAGITIEILKSK